MFWKFLALVGVSAALWAGADARPDAPERRKMRLVWADEFGRDGAPDSTKWGYDLGDGCPNVCGWGNNEMQYYTSRRENARVEDGQLVIEARKEDMGGKHYTSARLVSKHKGDWTYGRIEARVKLPKGRGTWPAFWMLPTEWKYGGWPASGEIDIMEFVGYEPDSVYGTVHTGSFNHVLGTQVSGRQYCGNLDEKFHTYAVDWSADRIDFLFDGKKYHSFENRRSGFEAWPFDKDFHAILNMAVGGGWGGKMGVDEHIWPQKMYVDYVRVYQNGDEAAQSKLPNKK